MLDNRFHAVMTAATTFGAQSNHSERQIHIVVRDRQISRVELVKVHQWRDCLSAQVHESLRLDEQNFFAVQKSFGSQRVETFTPRRCGKFVGEPVRQHESDVMFRRGIFGRRVAQPDKNFHAITSCHGSGCVDEFHSARKLD